MKQRDVKDGDILTVKREFITRGGESGEVVDVFRTGVALDFYYGVGGDPDGLPSIEFWAWGELEVEQ